MPTIVGTIRDADGNVRSFIDTVTQETLLRQQPCILEDDFVGAGHTAGIPAAGSPVAGYPWVKKIVGSGPPTVAIVANGAAGLLECTLTSTSEKEDAALYGNDQLNWDVTKNLVFESRFAMAVLPSVAGVEMVVGLQSAWIDGPDNASYYLRFQANGSGAVNCQSYDGTTTTSKASGVTFVAGAFHVCRIDATNVTDIAFYIDGVRVNAVGSIAFAATGAAAVLQMYASAYKASGAGVGTLELDTMSVSTDRV
jgi:hypothetical protein